MAGKQMNQKGWKIVNNHKTIRLRTQPTTQNRTLSKPQIMLHTDETGTGGVGNKTVTSKRDYKYQRRD